MRQFKESTIETYKAMLEAGGAEYVGQSGQQKLIARLACGHEKEIWTTVLAGQQSWLTCKACKLEKAISLIEEAST